MTQEVVSLRPEKNLTVFGEVRRSGENLTTAFWLPPRDQQTRMNKGHYALFNRYTPTCTPLC
jgi:hypothetical protein